MSLIRKHRAVLQAWACLALVVIRNEIQETTIFQIVILINIYCNDFLGGTLFDAFVRAESHHHMPHEIRSQKPRDYTLSYGENPESISPGLESIPG